MPFGTFGWRQMTFCLDIQAEDEFDGVWLAAAIGGFGQGFEIGAAQPGCGYADRAGEGCPEEVAQFHGKVRSGAHKAGRDGFGLFPFYFADAFESRPIHVGNEQEVLDIEDRRKQGNVSDKDWDGIVGRQFELPCRELGDLAAVGGGETAGPDDDAVFTEGCARGNLRLAGQCHP